MQEIINAFGFEWCMAPGEAEAELAYLNHIGVIDAVYTDDVDAFLFGAKMIVRNPSTTLYGNRAHALKNSAGVEDGNHVATYTSHAILTHPSIELTHGGLILMGILCGGDYHPAGLIGCGSTIAHGLARCGFGDSLYNAARTLPRSELRAFLRQEYTALAKKIPEDFPDIDVLLSYTNPVTSESEAASKGRVPKITMLDWEKEPDLGKIAGLCEMYFEWGVKETIMKRFRTILWPAVVLRILRRVALSEDMRTMSQAARSVLLHPATPTRKDKNRERHVPGTPSSIITKHFSSLHLSSPKRAGRTDCDTEDEGDEDKLIVKIHSSRQHTSTDNVLEYRIEVAPVHLVRLSESGLRGLRTALATGLDSGSNVLEGDESDGVVQGKKRLPKPPPNPKDHLRIWMPACMIRIARPDLVEGFERIQEMRTTEKVAVNARSTARGSKVKRSNAFGSKAKAGKDVAVLGLEYEEESSDGSPTPTRPTPNACAAKGKPAIMAPVPEQTGSIKVFSGVVEQPVRMSSKPNKAKSTTISTPDSDIDDDRQASAVLFAADKIPPQISEAYIAT
ncbi:uncharacterized protein B0H18DRAFT_1124551 [Fomitopsis serialis]|uniref:uncharacterized protein n=1 Tax=Fomitopsis serialis TaxID=139415 RepID=UPI0020088CC8|nr:uncharacterized protein B0H18DRAFT_1124551 [Neoantrodia serialis]KAH9916010.1 hypothetical protein B0H18DRAFT_1124551 [Neoantrodia serialis]